jgi:YbbR domain-containing protein
MAARDLIVNNFWWKLLSVFLAVLTWITIDASLHREVDQTPVITSSHREFRDVPVTILTSPYNTNEYRVNPVAVFVDISGNADVLKKLQTQQLLAFVDASRMQDEKEVRCDIRVQTRLDVHVEKVDPGYADVERITPPKPVPPSNSIPSNHP